MISAIFYEEIRKAALQKSENDHSYSRGSLIKAAIMKLKKAIARHFETTVLVMYTYIYLPTIYADTLLKKTGLVS